jgi:hypothetical protein
MNTRKDVARRKAVRALEIVRERIDYEFPDDKKGAAKAVGLPVSTFYRLMGQTPGKIDVIFLATVADWLHDNRNYGDFVDLWRQVTREIEQQPELREGDTTGTSGLVDGAQPLA